MYRHPKMQAAAISINDNPLPQAASFPGFRSRIAKEYLNGMPKAARKLWSTSGLAVSKVRMSDHEDIDEEIRHFIVTRIDSVPELEALLLLWRRRTERWSEVTLAQALYIDRPNARRILDALLRKGWIQRVESEEGCRFHDGWDTEGLFMTRLADVYRKRLVSVTALIHSNASASVRDFAKAFTLKKH